MGETAFVDEPLQDDLFYDPPPGALPVEGRCPDRRQITVGTLAKKLLFNSACLCTPLRRDTGWGNGGPKSRTKRLEVRPSKGGNPE